MPDTVNTRIKLKRDTTANWNAARGFIPLAGEVIIYTDYSSYYSYESGVAVLRYIPNIKIGTGNAYIQDLPFVDKDLRDKLMEHINDSNSHITSSERISWDGKLNYDSTREINGEMLEETLVFTRD